MRFAKCVAGVVVVLSFAAPAHALVDKSPAGSVGAQLALLMDRVNTAMTAASAAGNTAAMECGRDLAIAISSTQNVYEDELSKPLDGKVAPALKASVDQLDGAITKMASLTKESVQEAAVQALQISNSLPYRPAEPRLAKITPQFLVPSKDPYLVKMRFNGAFEYAAKPAFFPTLTIQTHAYKPIASSAGEIEFSVPISDVFPPGSDAKTLQFVTGNMRMPWEMTSLMGRKHSKKEDNFKLYLLALPSGPGTIKFMATATKLVGGEPKRYISEPYQQCSGPACDGNPDDTNHLWSVPHDPNCSVVKGSSNFDVTNSSGDWSKALLSDSGDFVTYSVSTKHEGKASASVDFKISFMESCSHEVPNDVGESVPMTWGDTQTIKAPAGTWKVSLDTFDGHHAEFTQTDDKNPLLKVMATKDSVTLTTPDPTTFVYQ
ncbi:MAG TPA: hypothetical protein VFC39_04335 [Acidobacteriaceae bacterium]|nr:hypothetical protein [Acidobacteriaceae bacterium]